MPVGTARARSSSAVCASVRCWLSGAKPVGERKKSRDHVLVPVGGGVAPEAAEELCWRSWRIRDCCRESFVLAGGDASNSGGRGTMDVPSSVVNSRNSFVVKAAWSGPRLPMMDTWRTVDRCRTSRTGAGTSYFSRMRGGVSNIRATSSATLPWPMIETCSVLWSGGGVGREGCWVYQWTNDSAGMTRSDGGRAGCRVGIVHPVEKRRCV